LFSYSFISLLVLPVIHLDTFFAKTYPALITFTKTCKYSNLKGGNMNIYVGNISSQLTEEELNEAFAAYGETSSVRIIKDKFTHQPRGFGFVEMPEKAEAEAAIAGLNGKELKGKELTVNEARPRRESFRGSSGGRSTAPSYGRSRWSN
jgi:RNA recognition motif-containing protein